jgi:hypothetical protein
MALASYEISIYDLVENQLDVVLKYGWKVQLSTDPFHLATELLMFLSDAKEFRHRVKLQPTLIDGRWIACKVPDWFVSHMLTVPYEKSGV